MIKCYFFIFIILFTALSVLGQTTEFTYQGSLKDNQNPANGNYDFEFALYDSLGGSSQIGSTIAVNNVAVTNGSFTVKLDFGNQFTGANRFLEIRIRQSGQGGLTTLSPRQLVNSSPYSVRSLVANSANSATTATTATNATQLGGIAASQYVQTNDARLSDARNPLPNSSNYIQNRTSTQSSANFNISGTGVANIFDASQYNIFGERILSVFGAGNTFVGRGSGQLNQPFQGSDNSFFGKNSGFNTLTGGGNSFFGTEAGVLNTSGTDNSFFGRIAGFSNTTGLVNSFFGAVAGASNTSGQENSFFGYAAGQSSTASGNSFFGTRAGKETTMGDSNSFFGTNSGQTNTLGSFNTLIGNSTNVGSNNLTYATAIGAGALVSTNNTIQLGRTSGLDIVNISGKIKVGLLGAGGITPLCINSSNEVANCSAPLSGNTTEQVKVEIELQNQKVEAQQKQINEQNEIIRSQQAEIEALKTFICSQTPSATFCKSDVRKP